MPAEPFQSLLRGDVAETPAARLPPPPARVVVLRDGEPLPAEILSRRGTTLIVAVPVSSLAQTQLDLGVVITVHGELRKARVLTRVLAQRPEPLRCVVRLQAHMVHSSDPNGLATVVRGLFEQPWVPGRARQVDTGYLYTLTPAARSLVQDESVPAIHLSQAGGPTANDLAFDGQSDDAPPAVTEDSGAIDLSDTLSQPFEAVRTRNLRQPRVAVRERANANVRAGSTQRGVPLSYRLRSNPQRVLLARVRGVKAEGILLSSSTGTVPRTGEAIQLDFPLDPGNDKSTVPLVGTVKPYPGVAGAFVVRLQLVPGAPATERWLHFLAERGAPDAPM